jgi:CMP-N-acetylneuraminic acid synthetase
MSEPKVIAFIFARGGSKGVPGKNIKPLAGKPLIAHAIAVARATPGIDTVIVSTDDEAIAAVGRAYGAEVPFMRPSELAQDTSSEWLAWRHAIAWVQQHRGAFDLFVSLPTTSPFRAVDDVAAVIAAMAADPQADIAITVAEANRSPYFNMVKLGTDGYAELVIAPDGRVTRRQDAPAIFDITTVAYAARPAFVLRANGLFEGKVCAVPVPAERALDIDTPYDFLLAEALASLAPGAAHS